MKREREKLKEILKYCLKDPGDLNKIRIVEEEGNIGLSGKNEKNNFNSLG